MSHIDEESAALVESMRVPRVWKNGQIPISRLPDEILLMIFKHFEEERRLNGYDSDDDFESDAVDDAPACLVVTHVCRRWRKVALECPTLWRFISSTSLYWLDVMLERSQQAPLVVTYTTFAISLKGCLEKILLHLPHIKYLELRALSYHVGRVMDLLSSQPAPMLETFKFSVYGQLPSTVSISDTIFQGQAPSLRYLEVDYCNPRWSSSIFSGLRTLYVAKTSLPDLLSALQCTDTLEQLTLRYDFLQTGQSILIDGVPLPRLKKIVLDGTSLETAVSLLGRLALPVNVKIALQLSSIEGHRTFADLFSVMNMHPGGSGPVFRSLRAIKLKPWRFAVQFSSLTEINSNYSWNPQDDDIQLSIQFYYEDSNEFQPNGPPAGFSRDIVFDMCKIIAQRSGLTFFSGKFESIYVEGGPDFIGGLTAALRIEGSSRGTYPSLRVLKLLGISFEGDELQNLRDVLTMRAKHEVPVHDLRLRLCRNFTADQMQLFQQVVMNKIDCDQSTLDHGSIAAILYPS
ncbi:uncharacterized protein EDB93DRAFT_819107 [Suillus bovinus]|uniref:uncharacterized protein n=1 Tax=Suillus bovinus TaxID=48563 RepID=UPI001B879740|nr:uncharacterized protein EDB93DRAFT_819107 [Suillus bovinus]KAG2157837.1 hypothetical protein EDB93DRAFT_819107 [Suillus bovinus]